MTTTPPNPRHHCPRCKCPGNHVLVNGTPAWLYECGVVWWDNEDEPLHWDFNQCIRNQRDLYRSLYKELLEALQQ